MEENVIGKLIIKRGPGKDREINLIANQTITIGRAEENDIFIPDKTVSRKHAELVAKEDSVSLVNYGVNGSVINGTAVRDDRPRSLSQDSTITIGPCIFQVLLTLMESTQQVSIPEIPSTAEPEKTRKIEKIAGKFPEEEKKPKEEEPQEGEKPTPKKGESQILKSPIAKVVVGVVLLMGLLALLLPKKEQADKEEAPKQQAQTKPKSVVEDSLALSVKIPKVTVQGPVPDDELQTALSYFKAAEKLFSEQRLRNQNIFDSIQKWEEGIQIIGKYQERPEALNTAVQNVRRAKESLHQKFRELEKSIRISAKQDNYKKVNEAIQIILASIPDRMDWRYRWAKQVESNIQPKLKRR